MVFLSSLCVNLHVCLCGDHQVASAQTLDLLDIGQKSSFPDWKLSPTAKSFPDGYRLFFRTYNEWPRGGRRPHAEMVPIQIRKPALPSSPAGRTCRTGPHPLREI